MCKAMQRIGGLISAMGVGAALIIVPSPVRTEIDKQKAVERCIVLGPRYANECREFMCPLLIAGRRDCVASVLISKKNEAPNDSQNDLERLVLWRFKDINFVAMCLQFCRR